MLNEEEKTKIRLEELFRSEVRTKLEISKPDLIDRLAKIIQASAIVIGILFTYVEYKRKNEEERIQEKERNEQAAKEYRKHFYLQQMEYYAEATEATATLATEEYGSEDYKKARKDFFRLFYGKLAIVEDSLVENGMTEFRYLLLLSEQKKDQVKPKELEDASLKLAEAAGNNTINVWLDDSEKRKYHRSKMLNGQTNVLNQ